jgi:hypothetical protein
MKWMIKPFILEELEECERIIAHSVEKLEEVAKKLGFW